jgi:hypothetical protein
MAKKPKQFNDGGVIGNANYPFGQGQAPSSAPAPNTGLGNTSPLVQVNTPGAEVAETVEPAKPFGMKKGGMVSSASKRADGCAQRGKTRGRMR